MRKNLKTLFSGGDGIETDSQLYNNWDLFSNYFQVPHDGHLFDGNKRYGWYDLTL